MSGPIKKQLICQIITELQIMRSIFDQVGVKKEYLIFCEDLDKALTLPIDLIREAATWVHDLYLQEYSKILSIKKLLSEELWARYKIWGGFEEHREYKMLQDALKDFRKKLIDINRPLYLKKGGFDAESRKYKPGKSETDKQDPSGKKSRRSSPKSKSNDD